MKDWIYWIVVYLLLSWAFFRWVILRSQETVFTVGEVGRASWYGEGYRGKRMANGQPFDPEAMTCAAWKWPLGSLLRVTHAASGRFVIVELTDRGPAQWTGCLVDLSARAFRRLEDPGRGRIEVRVEVARMGPEVNHE